jgi:sialic acid synthase SpsE
MKQVKISNVIIDQDSPVFVVAEIGTNFEYSFDKACEMVREAARCGVNAVKFQTYNPETNVTKTAPKFWDIEGTGSTQYEEQKDGLILNKEHYRKLKDIAHKCGVIFFSSVCDKEGVDMLEEVGVPAYKLASMEITNLPFLRYVASKGKATILSTGASDLDEIEEAIDVMKSTGNHQIILLHCISNYPTMLENVNLRRILELQSVFPDIPVGYSDHTIPQITPQVIISAVALGAKVIEKHFTFDSTRPGYDHQISADYTLMKQLVKHCRVVEKALGSSEIRHLSSEERVRLLGRRSVVARRFIPKDSIITKDLIIVKRPATGIQPKELERLIGKRALQDIDEDEVITWQMIVQ